MYILLLQILNPGFARNIKVFFDPYAGETASFGFGGIKVAGGDAKSYYVKKGEEVAFKLQSKNYEEEYKHLYGDCATFFDANVKKFDWSDLAKNIFDYTKECK